MNIKETTQTVYKIKDDLGEWADIMIGKFENNEHAFSLTIRSGFGDWSYEWGQPGKNGAFAFLNSCDDCYLLGKLSSRTELDREKTEENLKRLIISCRRSGEVSRDQARESWDELDRVDYGCEASFIYSFLYIGAFDWIEDELIFDCIEMTYPRSITQFFKVLFRPFLREMMPLNKPHAFTEGA